MVIREERRHSSSSASLPPGRNAQTRLLPQLPDQKLKESSMMQNGPQRESFFPRFLGQIEQLQKIVSRR